MSNPLTTLTDTQLHPVTEYIARVQATLAAISKEVHDKPIAGRPWPPVSRSKREQFRTGH